MQTTTFCRLIKSMVSSSFRDAFHGPCIGIMNKYHNVPLHNIQEEEETEAFNLINPNTSTDAMYRWRNCESVVVPKVLGPGMVLLKNYINLIGQVEIVSICDKWGAGPVGFYQPSNPSGAKLPLHMTCFGRNWDPVTKYENPYRSDGSKPPPIPCELISFTKRLFLYCKLLRGVPSMTMSPDICLVNFYSHNGRLDLHQDCDESSDSLKRGVPVVSISIGDSAEFVYGNTRDESKLDKVLLESGDVLIFGEESRLIFHGLKRILFETRGLPLSIASRMNPGRLNLTLRQY